MYKIKRLSDGLYSRGGMSPYFTKTGKVWTTLNGLKLHLRQFIREAYYPNHPSWYEDCIVIEIDDINGGIKEDVFNIKEFIKEKYKEDLAKRAEKRIKNDEYEAELRKLKEKYGKY